MNSTFCWYCSKEFFYEGERCQDVNCSSCGVQNSIYAGENPDYGNGKNPNHISEPQTTEEEWLNNQEEKGEKEMGELGKLARERSPFIRLAIGESSQPMIYKSWKEITGTFGDSFRYLFEVETEKGMVQKSFDCPQQKFAEEMDAIPFGAKVVIHRKQKVDGNGNAIENKSLYEAVEIRE